MDILPFVDPTSKIQSMWHLVFKVREEPQSVITIRRVWFSGPIIPNLKYHATGFFSRMHRLPLIPQPHARPTDNINTIGQEYDAVGFKSFLKLVQRTDVGVSRFLKTANSRE